VGEQNCQRLVAGHQSRRGPRRQHRRKGPAFPQALDFRLETVQKAGFLKNPRVAGGQAHDGSAPDHGEDAAAAQQGFQLLILQVEAGEQQHRQPGDTAVLERQIQNQRGQDACGQHPLHRHPERRQDQHQQGRKQSGGVQDKPLGKDGLHIRQSAAAGRGGHTQGEVHGAGPQKGHQRGTDHPGDILEQVCAGKLTDQQSACGHRGASVPKKYPRQNSPAHQHRVQPHGPGNAHADHAHGGRGAKGGAREDGHTAVHQKGEEQKGGGLEKPDADGDDHGDGAAGPPEGGEHPDEQEQDQHVPDGLNALPGHLQDFTGRKPLFAAVEEENDVASGQGQKQLQLQCHARQQYAQKQKQGDGFHRDDLLVSLAAGTW